MAKKPPGVMLYFDVLAGAHSFTLEHKGLLLDAILQYAEHGIAPDFSSSDDHIGLNVIWEYLRRKIDEDQETYAAKCTQAKKAIKTRWDKEHQNHSVVEPASTVYDRIPPYTNHTNYNYNPSQPQIQRQHSECVGINFSIPESHSPYDNAETRFEARRQEKMDLLKNAAPDNSI